MYLKLTKPLLICVTILMFSSCSEWKTKSQNPFTDLMAVDESPRNDSIIGALGNEIETLILEDNAQGYIDLFDYNRFVKRITYVKGGMKSLTKFEKGFKKGFKKGMREIPDRIIMEVTAGGFYDLISYRYDQEIQSYRMLFRLYSEESGLNYHDYELIYDNGKFKIVDIYVYLTGENLSESMNKIYLTGIPKNILEKILNHESNQDAQHFSNASTAVKRQDYASAVEHLDKIKGDLKNKKIFHVIKLQAAAQLNDEIHLKTLETFKEKFSDDPSGDLMFIDYYILKKDYAGALTSLEKLQTSTGDDFLDFLKAGVYYESGEVQNAIKNYQTVVEDYPDYLNAHLNLLSLYSEVGNYQESVNLLNGLMEANFFLPEDVVEYVEEKEPDGTNILQPLVDSEEYQKWKASTASI